MIYIYLFIGITVGLSFLKLYLKLTTQWCKSYTCLVGKTTIVTGANSGIGFETAADFAKRGAKVILACRNKAKGDEAKEKIISLTGNKNVISKILDLSSFKSIRAFAEDIKSSETRLDILVNNAGAMLTGNILTEDSIQQEMQVNYFGHFLLTNLLMGLLLKTEKTRVVNVSSIAAKLGTLDLDKINEYPGRYKIYANSKLCNILFTVALALKLPKDKVTAFSVHPGTVRTEVIRGFPGVVLAVNDIVHHIFMKTQLEGAQTTLFAALEPNIEKYNGEMFQECRVIKPYKNATNINLVLKLWKKSEELVKLAPAETIDCYLK